MVSWVCRESCYMYVCIGRKGDTLVGMRRHKTEKKTAMKTRMKGEDEKKEGIFLDDQQTKERQGKNAFFRRGMRRGSKRQRNIRHTEKACSQNKTNTKHTLGGMNDIRDASCLGE